MRSITCLPGSHMVANVRFGARKLNVSDNRSTVKSYLESVPRCEFVVTTDIHQTPGHEYVIGPVLLSSATMRHSRGGCVCLECRRNGQSRIQNGDPKAAVYSFYVVLLIVKKPEQHAPYSCRPYRRSPASQSRSAGERRCQYRTPTNSNRCHWKNHPNQLDAN